MVKSTAKSAASAAILTHSCARTIDLWFNAATPAHGSPLPVVLPRWERITAMLNTVPDVPGGLACWQARRALEHIESQLDVRVRVTELARLVQLSTAHFSRTFKTSLGMPPGAYMALRRVERAKILITSTADSLAQIALACGYADQAHLTKSFRRHFGVSPSAWRRLNGCAQP
jgi:AraC-like DNA-binding protein